jgi:hypothetical protein
LLQSNAEAEEPAKGFRSAIALRACVRKERNDVAGEQYSRDANAGIQDNRVSARCKSASNFIAEISATGSFARSARFSTYIPPKSRTSNLIRSRP